MPFHSHKLPNGLQLIGETSPSARSVAVGFFVRTVRQRRANPGDDGLAPQERGPLPRYPGKSHLRSVIR